MRRVVFALTAILVIVFLIQPLAQVTTVKANFILYEIDHPKIIVNSPLSPPYVYVKPSFDISFEYQVPFKLPQVESFSYKLDKNHFPRSPSQKKQVILGIILNTQFSRPLKT